ncbi:hypothetical protein [Butyrivibrio sp. MC2013]|uniref:hypothetical protein n=1 Tax=Butyrivibrio sp. MC2013 TaxID=1280686 RepID=UPI0004289C56|nr:hypothetical protein [Butyrivibrio sp. MC2013]
MNKEDKYGINMRKFCRDHEIYLTRAEENGDDPADTLKWHMKKLSLLQHERLVHLLVLMTTIIVTLFSLIIMLSFPRLMPVSAVVFLLLIVLTGFYLRHYFFLENKTQHWYRLAVELHKRIMD